MNYIEEKHFSLILMASEVSFPPAGGSWTALPGLIFLSSPVFSVADAAGRRVEPFAGWLLVLVFLAENWRLGS